MSVTLNLSASSWEIVNSSELYLTMPYSQFKTIAQAKAAFKLTIVEGTRFLPQTSPVAPSQTLSRCPLTNPLRLLTGNVADRGYLWQ